MKGLISVVHFRTYERWVKEQREGRKPGRVGRPRKIGEPLRQLILRLARENRGWGYLRIVGELIKLRCRVGKTSVRRILLEEGMYPTPKPGGSADSESQPWSSFIKMHMNTLVACDFFTKAIWTPFGRRDAYFLAFIHLGTRKVWVSSATFHPNAEWVAQQGRNLFMWLEEAGLEATHLIHDRDTKFTMQFDQLFEATCIRVIKSPVMAPNANAFAESWIATVKRECLGHFTCFALRHADYIVQTFARYYNENRPHQGLGNRVLDIPETPCILLAQETGTVGKIGCRSELGGLLKHYCRQAA